ncbi:MAG TPA: ADOP family duplicated permease [Gemmatimonadales bacterium]
MQRWWQDFRYAIRALVRTPLFTVGVVGTLALGIGINATMFSVVDTLFFRPPDGVGHPHDLVRVYYHHHGNSLRSAGFGDWTGASTSLPAFHDLRDHAGGFAAVAATRSASMGLGRGSSATQVNAQAVSYQYFPMLELHPALGRFFDSTDDRVGGPTVAVLSYAFWQSHFGGDQSVIGRQLPIGKSSYTVIGVAPKGFRGIDLSPDDLYLPIAVTTNGDIAPPDAVNARGWTWLSLVARVRPGEPVQAAAAAATRAARAGIRNDHGRDTTVNVVLAPIQSARGPQASSDAKVGAWVQGVALIVLLIACANVANLMLARGVGRRRELAVRASLGAGRGGLVRALLAESVVLAVAGAVAALLLADWFGNAVRTWLLPTFPPGAPLVSATVIVLTCLTLGVAVLCIGLVPAIQASRADVVSGLRSGGHGATVSGRRTREALLAVQIALTLALLVGAGLFVQSFRRAQQLDLGFDTDHLVSIYVGFGAAGIPTADANATYLRIADRLRRLPGVANTAATMGSPFEWSYATDLRAEGVDSITTPSSGGPYFEAVTPTYLATMGTRIVSGRDFTASDVAGAPQVAIVGNSFARRVWPGKSPLGRCLYVGDSTATCSRVVGVAADAVRGSVTETESMIYYLSFAQIDAPQMKLGATINQVFVRTRGAADAMIPAIRREVNSIGDLPYATIIPMSNEVNPGLSSWRLGASAFGAFALLALLIAATGIFAVLSYTVTQRTKEVGIRVALGAQAADVVRLVVGQAIRAAVAGLVAGGIASFLLGRAVAHLLFQVAPADPAVLTVTIAALLAVAAMAAFVPARRAAGVDPMVALRND